MQKTGGGLGRESPFSAYHLCGKPSNFGENSKGTVYSGGNFFGKTAVPPEDYLSIELLKSILNFISISTCLL